MNHKPTENDKANSLSLDRLHQYRHAQGQNQSEFWGRFGVTQSGGSRYENGRDVPEPTQLLLALRHLGRIDDPDLTAARKYLERSARKAAHLGVFAAGRTEDAAEFLNSAPSSIAIELACFRSYADLGARLSEHGIGQERRIPIGLHDFSCRPRRLGHGLAAQQGIVKALRELVGALIVNRPV